MTAAARKDDPIEHSSALGGLLTGLAIGAGAALVGLAIVGTGGLAAVAIVGAAAAAGAGIGEVIGSLSSFCSVAGQIISGSANVFINGIAAARAHLSKVGCDKHSGPQLIAEGSSTVWINGQPAARVNDRTTCDGKISAGSPNVFIGGGTYQTDEIDPEVPGWLHVAVFALGIGSAVLLGAGPGIILLGLAGGIAGGAGGYWLGGKIWGEGSDGQKLMALGGAFLGGLVGGKGGKWFDARYQIKVEGFGSNLGNVKIAKRPTLPSGQNKGISSELYSTLRSKTPSKAIQKAVNKDVSLPMKDPALPGLEITKPLHADHIVPMKKISEMDGFSKLTEQNQLKVLNNPDNFTGLSETANTSKGAKSFAEWTEYKKEGIKVDANFRDGMMKKAEEMEPKLQRQIYDLLEEQSAGN
ncbi:PAAR domain-containing protein [Pseudomonas sp. NBRC 100443]|uniref:PAAR domain-containing protein n=1 Tax=Pseudomonas sp. NBRC 100443 TaxID=1113665 RepID=UPI0024A35860|nr:PAAR domain-containing protein [Pseudomonas sp. NBRC 100443]GLU40003.1 hypothetical protein Pssp01_40960 [Pseudomonas sp. NBRC 100443]